MKQEQSYQQYRKHTEELNFKKENLLKIITLKKQAHEKYRQHHKEFRDLNKKQTELTKELIEMI